MGDNLEKAGFVLKYDNLKNLLECELTPLMDILLKISYISVNFANTASIIKNITINETHEVEEFLDIVFDMRKVADKLEDIIEYRSDILFKVIKSGIFDAKNILEKK
ncbi:hypothetical protein SAMN05660865_00042 [Caloramator fervidus]|uniref:PhoU domain-containing protein n=1 Tax=Caloramator fervidus TaxID=29344 RepID=A0A1H5RM83_9CLOT|nr:hypothetical protein [Caloramator fervidus]SEF38647.1 hypothetical protein SAMN05660865_00042 [Caloramator fervidus]